MNIQVYQYTGGIFLLACGLAVLGFLLAPILLSLRGLLNASLERNRTKRSSETLKRIDQLLDQDQYSPALKLLKQSFKTESVSTRDAIRSNREFQQNLLSRCVLLAEELSVQLPRLAEIEQLLIEHSELMALQFKADDTFRKIQQKRAEEQKSLPEWTKADFDRRAKEIKSEMKRNRLALDQALAELFNALEHPDGGPVVYH